MHKVDKNSAFKLYVNSNEVFCYHSGDLKGTGYPEDGFGSTLIPLSKDDVLTSTSNCKSITMSVFSCK